MKSFFFILLLIGSFTSLSAQSDKELVAKVSLDYIEGFYEGDTTKLIRSIKPTLYKLGFYKDKASGIYKNDGTMSYRQALDYATRVLKNQRFAKSDAPKQVEVLSVLNTIAATKITAWWGIDYLLLSKQDGKWMIEEILWEGPLESKQ